MIELLGLVFSVLRAVVRPRQDLVLENLLLRHQLAVLTRPTRHRPRARLRTWDKLLWLIARRFCAGWREHLVFVTPETVVRWHRQGWGRRPRHLLHDRDRVYGGDFRQRAERIGIEAIATPIHAPTANAIVERVIGTLRRECLDHLIVLNEQHLLAVLREFVAYYNRERPHRTLRLHTPEPTVRPVTGAIRRHPVLNGLHHVYERAA